METRKQVVILEPHRESVQWIQCLLSHIPCMVRTARGADLRQETAEADLVLCSWEEWLRSLKGAPQDALPHFPPVVMLAHAPSDRDWHAALEAGAFDLVEEPHSDIAAREFLRVVRLALEQADEDPGHQQPALARAAWGGCQDSLTAARR